MLRAVILIGALLGIGAFVGLTCGLVFGLPAGASLFDTAGAAPQINGSQSNLQLHYTPARHGLYSDSSFAGADVSRTSRVPGINTTLPGQVYAQARLQMLIHGCGSAPVLLAVAVTTSLLPPACALSWSGDRRWPRRFRSGSRSHRR